MTTNLLIGYPDIQFNAQSIVASATESTNNPFKNLYTGSRGDTYELLTSTSDQLYIDYDLGSGISEAANLVAFPKASLLKANGVTGIRLRASAQSAFTPSSIAGLSAWYDANRGVTQSAGLVSQWNDLSSNAYNATQGTSSKQPYLSRADNKENLCYNSQPTASGDVLAGLVSNVTFTGSLATDWANLFTTVSVFGDNSVTRAIYYGRTTASSITYTQSFYVRMDDASAPNITGGSGVRDFYMVVNGGATLAGLTSTSLGGGLYRISRTAYAGTDSQTNCGIQKDSSCSSKTFKAQGFQLQISSADTTYLATTTYPQFAGINGNRGLVFDGSNDSLAMNGLAAAFTGNDTPYTVFAVVKSFTTLSGRRILHLDSGATSFISILQNTDVLTVKRRDGVPLEIDLTFGNLGTSTAVLSVKCTGIATSIYKDGSASGSLSQSQDTGSLTLTSAEFAAHNDSVVFWGYICELLVYNSALSDPNRQSIEAYLTTKWETTAVYSIDSFDTQTLLGPNSDDWAATFAASSSSRHFWIQLVASTSSLYPHSKEYIGSAFDFGHDPIRPFSLDRTKHDLGERDARYKFSLTWQGITDTLVNTLIANILYWMDTNPVVLYDTNNYVLPGCTTMHCWIKGHTIVPTALNANTVTLDFEECI